MYELEENPITPNNLYRTPESIDTLVEWIKELPEVEARVANMAVNMTWNLASKLVANEMKEKDLIDVAAALRMQKEEMKEKGDKDGV